MPCPPGCVETLATDCRTLEEQGRQDELALHGLAHHLRFVIEAAPRDHPDLEMARAALADLVPAVIPQMPTFEDAGCKFGPFEALITPWHAVAEVVVPERTAWLCRVRTLAIRLGDAISVWPEAQAALRRYEVGEHRVAQAWARTLWLRGAELMLRRGVMPARWAVLEGQIEVLEALDDERLLRWLAPLD